jgi:hypothetical protein
MNDCLGGVFEDSFYREHFVEPCKTKQPEKEFRRSSEDQFSSLRKKPVMQIRESAESGCIYKSQPREMKTHGRLKAIENRALEDFAFLTAHQASCANQLNGRIACLNLYVKHVSMMPEQPGGLKKRLVKTLSQGRRSLQVKTLLQNGSKQRKSRLPPKEA